MSDSHHYPKSLQIQPILKKSTEYRWSDNFRLHYVGAENVVRLFERHFPNNRVNTPQTFQAILFFVRALGFGAVELEAERVCFAHQRSFRDAFPRFFDACAARICDRLNGGE